MQRFILSKLLVMASLGGSAIASLACIAFVSGGWNQVELGYVAWALMPYGILVVAGIAVALSSVHHPVQVLLAWATLLVAITGPLLYADVLFWHVDAQGALAVLMIPVIQTVVAVLLILAAGIWEWRIKSK